MASFAYHRGLPATTSMYAMPTRTAVSAATDCDGEEYPSQWPIAVTLKGRGREANPYRSEERISSAARLTRNTTRCRRRRNRAVSATVSRPSPASPHRDPTELRLIASESSHAVRTDVADRMSTASTPSSGRVVAWSQIEPETTTTRTAPSQSLPVRPIVLGRGGGAPVGRRCRWPPCRATTYVGPGACPGFSTRPPPAEILTRSPRTRKP